MRMYRPEDLRPGDIVLCEGEIDVFDPLGLIIKWATDNPFVHALVVGNGELIEAVENVSVGPLDKYAPVGWRFEVAGASPAQIQSMIAAAKTRVGQLYGYKALLEDGARYILHIPIWRKLSPYDLTCSGLVCWSYLQAGIRLTYAPLPSPADLSFSPVLVGPRPWQ